MSAANGSASSRQQMLDVLVLGGGVSGVSAGYHLKRGGVNFAIVERKSRLGGTWEWIKFPGIRSDSDMYTYMFPWHPWTSDQTIGDGDDIQRYVETAAAKAGIVPHVHFNTHIASLHYSSKTRCWTASTADGKTTFTARLLLVASGYYEHGKGYTPSEWRSSIGKFKGPVIHPQVWQDDVSVYKNKHVVVIGSGATAATVVPAMAKHAKHVTMLQRSPGYYAIAPRYGKLFPFLRKVIGAYAAAHVSRVIYMLLGLWFGFMCHYFPGVAKKQLLGAMKKELPSNFDFDKHCAPRYKPWDQRICLITDADWMKVIGDGKASVVTDTVASFDATGVKLGSGGHVDADVILTATGFDMIDQMPFQTGVDVRIDGKKYVPQDHYLYNSLMISDVPNMVFVMGYFKASWTLKAEHAAAHATALAQHMKAKGYTQVVPRLPPGGIKEVSPDVLEAGYVKRGMGGQPKTGPGRWSLAQNPLSDFVRLNAPWPAELKFE